MAGTGSDRPPTPPRAKTKRVFLPKLSGESGSGYYAQAMKYEMRLEGQTDGDVGLDDSEEYSKRLHRWINKGRSALTISLQRKEDEVNDQMNIFEMLPKSEVMRMKDGFVNSGSELTRAKFAELLLGAVRKARTLTKAMEERFVIMCSDFFEAIDIDGSGTVSWDELTSHLVQSYTSTRDTELARDFQSYHKNKVINVPLESQTKNVKLHYEPALDMYLAVSQMRNPFHSTVSLWKGDPDKSHDCKTVDSKTNGVFMSASFMPTVDKVAASVVDGNNCVINLYDVNKTLELYKYWGKFLVPEVMTCVKSDPYSNMLFTGGKSGSVYGYSTDSVVGGHHLPSSVFETKGHTSGVTDLLFLPQPNPKHICSASLDGSVALLDFFTQTKLADFGSTVEKRHHQPVTCLAYSEHHNLLISGGFEPDPILWVPINVNDRFVAKLHDGEAPHTGRIVGIFCPPATPLVITIDSNSIVKFWDIRKAQRVASFHIEQKKVRSKGEMEGHHLVAAGFDTLRGRFISVGGKVSNLRELKIYGYSAPKPADNDPTNAHDGIVSHVIWNKFMRTFLLCSGVGISMWNGQHGTIGAIVARCTATQITAACADDKGKRFILGTHGGTISVHSFVTAAVQYQLVPIGSEVSSVQYSGAQKFIVATSSRGRLLLFKDDEANPQRAPVVSLNYPNALTQCIVSSYLGVLIVADEQEKLSVYDSNDTHPCLFRAQCLYQKSEFCSRFPELSAQPQPQALRRIKAADNLVRFLMEPTPPESLERRPTLQQQQEEALHEREEAERMKKESKLQKLLGRSGDIWDTLVAREDKAAEERQQEQRRALTEDEAMNEKLSTDDSIRQYLNPPFAEIIVVCSLDPFPAFCCVDSSSFYTVWTLPPCDSPYTPIHRWKAKEPKQERYHTQATCAKWYSPTQKMFVGLDDGCVIVWGLKKLLQLANVGPIPQAELGLHLKQQPIMDIPRKHRKDIPTLARSWAAHKKAVTSMDMMENVKCVCTSGGDGKVCIWTIKGRLLGRLEQGRTRNESISNTNCTDYNFDPHRRATKSEGAYMLMAGRIASVVEDTAEMCPFCFTSYSAGVCKCRDEEEDRADEEEDEATDEVAIPHGAPRSILERRRSKFVGEKRTQLAAILRRMSVRSANGSDTDSDSDDSPTSIPATVKSFETGWSDSSSSSSDDFWLDQSVLSPPKLELVTLDARIKTASRGMESPVGKSDPLTGFPNPPHVAEELKVVMEAHLAQARKLEITGTHGAVEWMGSIGYLARRAADDELASDLLKILKRTEYSDLKCRNRIKEIQQRLDDERKVKEDEQRAGRVEVALAITRNGTQSRIIDNINKRSSTPSAIHRVAVENDQRMRSRTLPSVTKAPITNDGYTSSGDEAQSILRSLALSRESVSPAPLNVRDTSRPSTRESRAPPSRSSSRPSTVPIAAPALPYRDPPARARPKAEAQPRTGPPSFAATRPPPLAHMLRGSKSPTVVVDPTMNNIGRTLNANRRNSFDLKGSSYGF